MTVNSIIYDTGANVSVGSRNNYVRNVKSKKVVLVTPIGTQIKDIALGDTVDGKFKKVLILQDSANDIDSTIGLLEAGYSKQFLSDDNSYLFTNSVTGDQRRYLCRNDGLYHLVDEHV